jgi:hypothetical protein
MLTKTKIAVAAVLMLGAASAAQAGSKDDADYGGGYKVGPLGQTFGGRAMDHRALPGNAAGAFAYDASHRNRAASHR